MDPREDTDGLESVLWDFGHLVTMVPVLSAMTQEMGWIWNGSPLEYWDREWEESGAEMRERGNELYEEDSRRFSPGGIEEEAHPDW